jgi:hypothetical protein
MFAPPEYWENWEAVDKTVMSQEERNTLKKELKEKGFTVASKRWNFTGLGYGYSYQVIGMKDKTGTKTHKEIIKEVKGWF